MWDKSKKVHTLKSWPQYFEPIANGQKAFEFRFDDRGYKVGDVLMLQEWNPNAEQYTGRATRRRITYILRDRSIGVPEGYAILSLTEVE